MDLRELYQEVILDHNKRPRNFRVPDPSNRTAEGYNPLCGDKITIFLYVEGNVIKDLGFQGTGCAISKASASLMTDALKGKTLDQANASFDQFHHLGTGPATQAEADELGKLAVLGGVREYPMRVKCASLAWHTLKAAMQAEHDVISTEERHPAHHPARRRSRPLRFGSGEISGAGSHLRATSDRLRARPAQ